MEFQVKNRLVGLNKEKIINKLIKTYQLKGDDKGAIALVEKYSKFPLNKENPLLDTRQKLYIKSLINNRQYEDALAFLYQDESFDSDQLRAEIFGKMGDWDSFNENSEPYLYSIRYKEDYSLTNEDKEKIQNMLFVE